MNAAEKMRIDAQEQTEIMLPLFPGIEDYPWEGGVNRHEYGRDAVREGLSLGGRGERHVLQD